MTQRAALTRPSGQRTAGQPEAAAHRARPRLSARWPRGPRALVFPWVGLELTPSMGAWSIPLAWAPFPTTAYANYGVAVLGLLVVAGISSSAPSLVPDPIGAAVRAGAHGPRNCLRRDYPP